MTARQAIAAVALTALLASCAVEATQAATDPESERPPTKSSAPASPPSDPPSVASEPPSPPPPSPPPPAPVMSPKDSSDKVRELQHRLTQLELLKESIDGIYGPKTGEAVAAFQTSKAIKTFGYVDQSTWDALVAATKTPTRYQLLNLAPPGDPLISPGAKGDKVKDLQARLKQLGRFSVLIDGEYGPMTEKAVKKFQLKHGLADTGKVDQQTLDKLNSKTRKPTADELANVTPKAKGEDAAGVKLDQRCMTGRVLCASKSERKLRWVVDGQILKTFSVRFGRSSLPTAEGHFHVTWKSKDHYSKKYQAPMPYAMFFYGGQAIHYSPEFAGGGYGIGSHGCVNVKDKAGIAQVYSEVRVGDSVVVYR